MCDTVGEVDTLEDDTRKRERVTERIEKIEFNGLGSEIAISFDSPYFYFFFDFFKFFFFW